MTLPHSMLGVALALVALLLAELTAAAVVAAGSRIWAGLAARRPAAGRAALYFWLRVTPAIAAVALVAWIVVPSYLEYEPPGGRERASLTFCVVALTSLAIVGVSLWRAAGRLWATHSLLRDWRSRAAHVPTLSAQSGMPVYRLSHDFPVVAVVGLARPALFISDSVIETLAPDELQAAMLHERGHVRARDNLRRLVMGCVTGGFGLFGAGRALEQRWADAAEQAADDYVVRTGSANTGLALASALIKIARLVPDGMTAAVNRPLPVATYLLGATESRPATAGDTKVVARVRSLADSRARSVAPDAMRGGIGSPVKYAVAILAIFALFAAADRPVVRRPVHTAAEQIVHGFHEVPTTANGAR